MTDSINNTDELQTKLTRSSAIDKAFLRCAEILKCNPKEVEKRIIKMTGQIKQCEQIIGELNG